MMVSAGLAQKIAACGPLGIKATLESAHLSIDESEAAAFAKLNEQSGALFHTEDFIEGRNAEAEGHPPSTKASKQAHVPVVPVMVVRSAARHSCR